MLPSEFMPTKTEREIRKRAARKVESLAWYYKCGNCPKRLECKNNDGRARDPNIGEVLCCDMFAQKRK